ncbi:unnamed protein product, partial [Rotaria sp. Silwood1]
FNCLRQPDILALQWNVTFPSLTQQVLSSSHLSIDYSSSTYILSGLHLADLYIDIEYRPDSNASYGRPLCCRDGIPKPDELGAGFQAAYRICHLPLRIAESMLKYIVQNEKQIDFIYFTGDIA